MKKSKFIGLALALFSAFALTSCNSEPVVGPQGPQGETGQRGEDGVSIVSVDLTSSDGLVDIYTITYSDGTTSNFIVTNGKDGEQGIQGIPGQDGHTPVITISSDGYWVIDGVKTNTKAQGEQGEPGKDGTSLLTGGGEPSANLGKNGDSYIDLDTWDFYVKTSGTWIHTGNIKGEQGNQGNNGIDGIDGTAVLTGEGEPSVGTGKNGDSYIDLSTWNYYVKENDEWVLKGNIKGSDGTDGEDGNGIVSIELTSSSGNVDTYTITYDNGDTSTFTVTNGVDGEQGIQGEPGEDGHTPVITIGKNGNWYIDGEDTGVLAEGVQGPQGEPGKDGTSLLTGSGEPSANLGNNGDSYIDLDTWDFYVKTSETWNCVGKIKGDQGNDGQAGGDGEDGLSAYEIYIKYHPEYTGTEEEWVNDFINGNLFDNNSSIILEGTGEPIFINDIFQINYKTNNINGQLTWESSNNEIAKVDDNGCVTALGAGEVTITASYLKYSDSITFTIFERNQVVSEGFSFAENDNGYSIVGYKGSDVIVNVPSEYNGLPVTEIEGISAPYILEIYIPSSVTTIREGSFASCNKLEKIFIPQSVSTIEGSIFSVNHSVNVYCETFTKPNDWADNWYASGSSLQARVRIVWGSFLGQNFNYDGVNYAVCSDINNNKYIEAVSQLNPFDYNISLLDSYIIGGEKIQVKSIAQYAFAWCGLKTVHLPNSITSIGTEAFVGCCGLDSINIPESVVEIGASAFTFVRGNIYCKTSSPLSGWDKLFNYDGGKLIFNSYLEQEFHDGNYTYAVSKKENGSKYITILEYDGLEESIVVPDYFTFNGENIYVGAVSGFAFGYCENIISIHLPDTITYLGEGAFYQCTNLSTINIPNQTTTIEHWCFDSNSFTSINIPDSVTKIGENAFQSCYNLTTVTFGENSQLREIGSAFSSCSSLTSITIPDSVTKIGEWAFAHCSNLATVNIEENSQLTEIGEYAFSDCLSLTSIYIPSSVTTIGKNPFQSLYNLTIYCEASATPSGWDSDWNESNCPVEWGITYEDYLDKVLSNN